MDGNGESRLDRIERALERMAGLQDQFQDDLKALLTAQVVLTDHVDKLAERVDKLAGAQLETTDKLNALISLMDRHLGDHREGRA